MVTAADAIAAATSLRHATPNQRGNQFNIGEPLNGRVTARSDPLASAKRAPARPALTHASAPRGNSIDCPVASQ